jgi:methionyl-tRNA formyltransferase
VKSYVSSKRVEILTGDLGHPFLSYLKSTLTNVIGVEVSFHQSIETLQGGEFLLLASCPYFINSEVRSKFNHTLLVHASNLPRGKGWSPYIWELLAGADSVTLSLLEAEDEIDSGAIWKKIQISIEAFLDFGEISEKIGLAQAQLFRYAIENEEAIKPYPQDPNISPTYYSKRSPNDSCIDSGDSFKDAFNKIRLCDPYRYPAYFNLDGNKYLIKIERVKNED